MDLKLDPLTWDISLPIRFITADEETTQRIIVRLRMFLGEWFEDAKEGMPYFERILEKGVTPPIAASLVRQCVESVPGVAEVVRVIASIDKRTRTCEVSQLRIRYSATGSVVNVPRFVVSVHE